MAEFAIYGLDAAGGVLALSPIPSGAAMETLRVWQPDLVLTMTTQAELETAQIAELGADLAALGIAWLHLPVPDFGVPETLDWPAVQTQVFSKLRAGRKVLVHCKGGCGRSGMIVLRLMIAAGEAPDQALARLRGVRPCAVETAAQLDWATQN